MKSSTANYEKILKVISHRVQSLAMKIVGLEAKKSQYQSQSSQMEAAIKKIQIALLIPKQQGRHRTREASGSRMQAVHVGRNECGRLSEQIQGINQKRMEIERELETLRIQYEQEYSREQALRKLLDRRRSESRLERMKRDQLQIEEHSAQKLIHSTDVEFSWRKTKSESHSSGDLRAQ
ncbi:hypothetical protein [Thalassoglobus sp.]|uniref:hypothetical protein n=1 Tax=Thalassoglobus sp. TaxID=2795869 RepID=UPI003AA979BD